MGKQKDPPGSSSTQTALGATKERPRALENLGSSH